MFIEKVIIENYRKFQKFEANLSKLTVIIGENDSGKSSFLEALALPLGSSNIEYNSKRLGVSDINISSIETFYKSIIDKETKKSKLKKIPRVSVTIQFSDPQGFYETEIVSKWCDDDNGEITYRIRYEFIPKNDEDFLTSSESLLENITDINKIKWFTLPIEHYEYQIVSVHNGKQISFIDLKNVSINTIGAERDDFSDSNTMKSNNILTKLLINTLSDSEKNTINSAYTDFFTEIEDTNTFKKILASDDTFENIKKYIEDIECIPNLPNLKNILSNITLGYDDEFLYQKGLGERNLVYIFLLFTYYKTTQRSFTLCCIEEPEAHLSVNNLRLGIDYIRKSVEKSNTLLQTILSTHNPNIINKLDIKNVLVFSGEKSVNLSSSGHNLQNYLRKRPNFDILKLLFADRVLLVEGPSEEMLINSFLSTDKDRLNNIEVISIGQKGYRTFLDIWLHLNRDSNEKKIGIVRDFDNQNQAKEDHHEYDNNNKNITVRTTKRYTLEDDLVRAGKNCKTLSKLFSVENDADKVAQFMKDEKTECMLRLCDAMLADKKPIKIDLPSHISEVIEALYD